MNKAYRFAIKYLSPVLLLFTVCFVCTGCSVGWKYDPITDVNNLEGRRVGVNLSWEADFFLEGRRDMQCISI
jgi:hypothetical protein